jgi:hypothetical protein
MAVDVGTLGSSPALVVVNDMLIAINDPKITSKVSKCYLYPKEEISKLKRYVKDNDVSSYVHLLRFAKERVVARIDKLKDSLPLALYTHLQCGVAGLFREANREVKEQLKENVRRRQRGQPPL